MTARTNEQTPQELEAHPVATRGDVIVPRTKPSPSPGAPERRLRNSNITWKMGALIVVCVFAFAVGLKVYPAVASALAIVVLGVALWQGTKG